MVQQSEHLITIGFPIVRSICMGRALNDLSNNVVISGPTITKDLIYFKRIYDCLPKCIKSYYGLSRYIHVVVLSSIMYNAIWCFVAKMVALVYCRNWSREVGNCGNTRPLPRPIVCLTQVWQSLLPLFCDKTFEFAIQTWQTSLEQYYVYVQTYFLSQIRKMLILLISSYCKMCTLPTLRSRVFVCCEQYRHAR